MTVRETLDFAGRCMGVGSKYDMLVELSRREKERGFKPVPEIDAFMKATAVSAQKTSLTTDYVLKVCSCSVFFFFFGGQIYFNFIYILIYRIM